MKAFGRREHLLEEAQDVLKRLPVVSRIEDGLANGVEAIAKQTRGERLRSFYGGILPYQRRREFRHDWCRIPTRAC